jgi:hypothetical protein
VTNHFDQQVAIRAFNALGELVFEPAQADAWARIAFTRVLSFGLLLCVWTLVTALVGERVGRMKREAGQAVPTRYPVWGAVGGFLVGVPLLLIASDLVLNLADVIAWLLGWSPEPDLIR